MDIQTIKSTTKLLNVKEVNKYAKKECIDLTIVFGKIHSGCKHFTTEPITGIRN